MTATFPEGKKVTQGVAMLNAVHQLQPKKRGMESSKAHELVVGMCIR